MMSAENFNQINMKRTLLLFATALLLSIQSYAQTGVAINPTGAEADSSAMLDVSSTIKGWLVLTTNNLRKRFYTKRMILTNFDFPVNPSVDLIFSSVDLCEINCYTEFHRGEMEYHRECSISVSTFNLLNIK
jgi:hypothetical protein